MKRLFEQIETNTYNYSIIKENITSQTLILDIETTGLSSVYNQIYLIGVVFLKDNTLSSCQWIGDCPEDEELVLSDFVEFIKDYNTIITYNGELFDLPFINKRAKRYDLEFSMEQFNSIDLMKTAKIYKNILKLMDCKQKTIENTLGIIRQDKLTGKELIDVYNSYTKDHDTKDLELLLLHNYDDIVGLTKLILLINIDYVFCGNFTINDLQNEANELIITASTKSFIPCNISYMFDFGYIYAVDHSLKIIIKTFNTTLKYFFKDYKNYYYLTLENKIVHKSIAQYVDNAYKEKCTKENCFIELSDTFIPDLTSNNYKQFKDCYNAKTSFIQLSDIINNEIELHNYIKELLKISTK